MRSKASLGLLSKWYRARLTKTVDPFSLNFSMQKIVLRWTRNYSSMIDRKSQSMLSKLLVLRIEISDLETIKFCIEYSTSNILKLKQNRLYLLRFQ